MRPVELKDERGSTYEMGPTRHGEGLLTEWIRASVETDRFRAIYERHAKDEKEAEERLGKWMLPPDAIDGEKVCMWNGPNLIQAEKTADSVRVTIRSRHSR